MITSTELWAMKRILSLHSRKELRFASIPLVQLFLLVLLMFMKISSASFLQSARIAQSRESNLDSCGPMSLGSYRPANLLIRTDSKQSLRPSDMCSDRPEFTSVNLNQAGRQRLFRKIKRLMDCMCMVRL